MLLCRFCDKECKSANSLRNHERLCKSNPDKQESGFKKYNETGLRWNSGLTKETDDRVLQNSIKTSEALKKKFASGVKLYAHTDEYWTPERRKEKSDWRKQLHIDHPEMHPNRKLAGNRHKMTYPERVAYDHLTKSGVIFEHQKKVLKYFPDFVIGNIIIEIDGENWHNEEEDRIRDEEISKEGYTVYRIKSKERIEQRINELLRLV
jgi:very-short-patch-repair endonuclease